MPTRAFLLSADQKALDAITQTLSELEVSFEIAPDLAAGLKQIGTQHFELILADCDDGQSATQVFAAAKSSALNQGSMAIAIADGKAGVVNAFRDGASLVLSKPVSMEQARGTLRNALAVLRKTASETKAPAHPPQTTLETAKMPNAARDVAKAAPSIAPTQPVMKSAAAAAGSPTTIAAVPPSTPLAVAKHDIQKPISSPKEKGVAKPAKTISLLGEEPLGSKPPAPPMFAMAEKEHSGRRASPFLLAAVAVALVAAGLYGYATINPNFHGMLFAQIERVEVMSGLAPKPQPAAVVHKPAPAVPTSAPAAPPVVATAPSIPDGFVEPQPVAAQEPPSNEPAKSAAPAIVNTSTTTTNPVIESEPMVVPEDVAESHVAYRVDPIYPEAARRKKVKGSVVLNAAIDKDGNVAALEVASGNASLASAAVAAVKQWRYQVYYHNGQPSEFQTQVTVQFPQPAQR